MLRAYLSKPFSQNKYLVSVRPGSVSRRPWHAHACARVMSTSKRSDMPPTDPQLIEPPYRRKRRVEAGAQEGADEQVAATNGNNGTSGSPMAEDEPDRPVARGQPLKQFVENWEFRWDVQRDLYPWEWGQGGNLSDGPYNIIRYGQPPPKGWQKRNQP